MCVPEGKAHVEAKRVARREGFLNAKTSHTHGPPFRVIQREDLQET